MLFSQKGRSFSVGLALLGLGLGFSPPKLFIFLGKDHSLYQEGLSDNESDLQEVRQQATGMDM